jgi:DNA-3-methyladenine glycosylase II
MSDPTVVHRTVLTAAAPYDFALSLRALEGFMPGAGDHRVADERVRRAFLRPPEPTAPPDPGAPPGQAAVLVEAGPAAGGVALAVRAQHALSAAGRASVETAVRRWLGLDDDLSAFLGIARADPAMAPLLAVAQGLHQVRFATLAEAAVYFTLTQRSTQWYAAARKRRLAAEQGASIVVDGVTYPAFPALPMVAALDDETLIGYAGNKQRADRIHSVVEGLVALDEDWLRTGPYGEVRAALLAIQGIGPFTADGLLLRGLGRPDDVPLEMAQFTAAAKDVYGEPPPTPAELRARYGPWIGWWAYYARTATGWLPRPDAVPEPARAG